MVVTVSVKLELPHKELIEPSLLCSCGDRAASKKCSSEANKGRWFYRCRNGWVENSTAEEEDPAWRRHLRCDLWVWQDVITRFAEDVFEINEMKEETLKAEILEKGRTPTSEEEEEDEEPPMHEDEVVVTTGGRGSGGCSWDVFMQHVLPAFQRSRDAKIELAAATAAVEGDAPDAATRLHAAVDELELARALRKVAEDDHLGYP